MRAFSLALCCALSALCLVSPRTAGAVGWEVEATTYPTVTGDAYLEAVSCKFFVVNTCAAGGLATEEGALALHWANSEWLQATTPASALDEFFGISCVSPFYCVGVGVQKFGETLAEVYNEGGWSAMTTPNPGSSPRKLHNVSCLSTKECAAVGSYVSEGVTKTLAIRWNGTSWSTETTANPGSEANELRGLSCAPAGGFCVAVGKKRSSEKETTLAMSWNGTSWSTQTTPTPEGATFVQTNAVSCPSSTECTAVGVYRVKANEDRPFAMRWNGSSWTLQEVKLPAKASAGVLNGVSCVSKPFCMAAGTYTQEGGDYAMAQEWRGWEGKGWEAEEPPSPGPAVNRLTDVSCIATNWCKAVGDFLDESGERQILIEHFSG